jgi:hypothetical protein
VAHLGKMSAALEAKGVAIEAASALTSTAFLADRWGPTFKFIRGLRGSDADPWILDMGDQHWVPDPAGYLDLIGAIRRCDRSGRSPSASQAAPGGRALFSRWHKPFDVAIPLGASCTTVCCSGTMRPA